MLSDLHQVLIGHKRCNRSLAQRHRRKESNDQPIAICERDFYSYSAHNKCSILGPCHELNTDLRKIGAGKFRVEEGPWYRHSIDALGDDLKPGPISLWTDQAQCQSELMQQARDRTYRDSCGEGVRRTS